MNWVIELINIKENLNVMKESLIDNFEITGLSRILNVELYENGIRVSPEKMNLLMDNHKIYYTDSIKRIFTYSKGYQIDLPVDWEPDYTLSALRDKYISDDVILTISQEDDYYKKDSKEFIDRWVNYHILNQNFRKANNLTLISDTIVEHGKYHCEILKIKLEGLTEDRLAYYTYVYFYDKSTKFYRFMFKSKKNIDVSSIVDSFQPIVTKGICTNNFSYELKIPEKWSGETIKYYRYLQNSNHVDWGLFTSRIESTGFEKTVPSYEKRMNYKFPVISKYVHYSWDGFSEGLPMDFARKADADGRILQISYQYTSHNNTELMGYTPVLDIYRGKKEAMDKLHGFAKQIKEYGKPLLFRLNNEMNTDWTSYCALVNMGDPDIFIDTWIKMYNIFEEEGVNNAIWIFNAFDFSYPPGNWSNYLNYLPPSDYVHMIGLTGYNFARNSMWKSFQSIYDAITEDYMRYFSKWPWIISEFACGYDYKLASNAENIETANEELKKQTQWVKEMFDCFEENRYPNIKAAIWFSANDYDENHVISNPFSLDESSDETINAFKDGFARTKS